MSQYHHNFRSSESNLNPPDEPDVYDDEKYLSTCCTANRWNDTDLCSYCQEHATFEDVKGNEEL